MINVRMAQHHVINLFWIEWKSPIAFHRFIAMSLEQPAFKQKSFTVNLEKIHGARGCASSSKEVDAHVGNVLRAACAVKKMRASRKGSVMGGWRCLPESAYVFDFLCVLCVSVAKFPS